MESEKRRRIDEDSCDTKKQKATVKDGESPAAEKVETEEVEEFFAILRRIQVVVKYFGKGWRAAAEMTDVAAAVDDKDNADDDEDPAEAEAEEIEEKTNCVLDLNVDADGDR